MTNPGNQKPLAPSGPYDESTPSGGRSRPGVIGARPLGSSSTTPGQPGSPPLRTGRPVGGQPARNPDTAPTVVQPSSGGVAGAKTPTPTKRDERSEPSRKPRAVRRAKLRMVRLDPWSVTKVSFLLAIAFGVMCVVAVFLIFSILAASGLWDNVNSTIQNLVKQKEPFDVKEYVGMDRVMGITLLIAAINVVLLTALATLGAFIYNMAASLLGGLEVTLAEDLR